jgi:chitinase
MPHLNLRLSFALLAASLFLVPAASAQSASPRPLLTGYFPQWGLYNEPQYLVKNLLTPTGAVMLDQLNYAQAFVTDGHCSVADPNADINYTFSASQSVDGIADSPDQPLRGNFNQLIKLKQRHPHLKIILSLEGKAASFSEDAQPEHRQAFVASCVDLFLKGNIAPGIQIPSLFDGIDVDWEYPHEADAANYIALLTEFRTQMDAVRPGLLLNIAVGTNPRSYIGTNMGTVAKLVNQIGLMTYDFNGPWSDTTGFLAPLYGGSEHKDGTVESTVLAYRAAGVPASQLFLGIPFYGYGWRQVIEDNNGLFQEGVAIHGDRPYRYIQTLLPESTVYRDPDSQAPWLFDGDIFWTFEDPISIRHKTTYAKDQQLGGLMIWELGEDTSSASLLQSAYDALKTTEPPPSLDLTGITAELPTPIGHKKPTPSISR